METAAVADGDIKTLLIPRLIAGARVHLEERSYHNYPYGAGYGDAGGSGRGHNNYTGPLDPGDGYGLAFGDAVGDGYGDSLYGGGDGDGSNEEF